LSFKKSELNLIVEKKRKVAQNVSINALNISSKYSKFVASIIRNIKKFIIVKVVIIITKIP